MILGPIFFIFGLMACSTIAVLNTSRVEAWRDQAIEDETMGSAGDWQDTKRGGASNWRGQCKNTVKVSKILLTLAKGLQYWKNGFSVAIGRKKGYAC